MTKKTLYIFYPEHDVSAILPNSKLLTSCDQELSGHEFHTSIGDMLAADIISVSEKFDIIELVNTKFDTETDTVEETNLLLNYLSHNKSVKNFSNLPPNAFVNSELITRIGQDRQLWVFGCSHSHGIGLTSPDHRFGSIVADQLNLPSAFVTLPGSSLQWSLRHIVNSDIKANDIVIWQLTTPDRVSLYNNTVNETMLSQSSNRCLLDTFNDQQTFFHQCSLINYGVQYLRTLGVKFIMTSLLHKNKLFYAYLREYTRYPEYCYIPNSIVDLGTDRLHAGPLSHQNIAQRILNHIQ